MGRFCRTAASGSGPAGSEDDEERPASRTPPGAAQVFANRWPADLIAEVSAAPSRRVAAELFQLSQSAIDTLTDDEREALLEALQDILAELPDGDVRRRGLPLIVAARGRA